MDELQAALELATPEELQQLTHILFCRRFNPLDYWQTTTELEVQAYDRASQIETLAQRFRFLAADGLTVLRRRTAAVSYGQVLIRVCQFLKIPHTSAMAVQELEAEIFLHLLGQTWHKLPAVEQQALNRKIRQSLARSAGAEPLPPSLLHNPVPFMLCGSGVIALTTVVRGLVLRQIAQQLTLHLARYQAVKTTLTYGGVAAATQVQNQIALQAARRGIALTAARQGAVRTAFAVLGPVLWTTLAVDLGWRTIATNYGRIIPTIFTLAQIRLTRTTEPVASVVSV